MRLRTFTAPDMPSAMKMVRDTLGDSAIILSSDSSKVRRSVTVTAAVDPNEQEEPPSAPKILKEKLNNFKVDQLRQEIYGVLRFHNIPELFVSKLVRYASDEELEPMLELQRVSAKTDEKFVLASALEKVTENYFRFDPLKLDGSPMRLMLLGTPGIGKTLTIAKMAAQLTMAGKSGKASGLTVISTDNKRAGGVEQLQAFTNILGITLHTAQNAGEAQTIIRSLPPGSHILVDTAGCNPYDSGEIRELKGLATMKGIEPVLVLPAGGDSLEAIDMVENFASMPIHRIIVTRADTARRLGGIMAAAAAHGLAFCNLSGSSSIVDALQPMNGALLAKLLLRYQLHSQ